MCTLTVVVVAGLGPLLRTVAKTLAPPGLLLAGLGGMIFESSVMATSAPNGGGGGGGGGSWSQQQEINWSWIIATLNSSRRTLRFSISPAPIPVARTGGTVTTAGNTHGSS